MDIHKPKPFHNLREFLSEIVVIVIGIAIALGGEQLIEAHHWREQVAEARETLDDQARDALLAAERVQIATPCELKRLARLQVIVSRPGRTPGLKIEGSPRNGWTSSAWQAATASGAVARMKPEARIGYANIFGGLEALRALYMNGYALEDDLRTLETPGILNDVSRDRLESDIAHLRGAVLAEQGASSAFAHQVRAMGIELAEQQKVQLAKDRKAPCIMPDEAAAS